MYCDNKIWIGDADGEKVCILPKMANRHGLIAGATGTGKTITLKVLAESFSDAGVPVFLADIKGDLSGMIKPGVDSEDMTERIQRFGLDNCGFTYQSYPVAFWDIFGKAGIPLRTTVSEMGPVLLSKLMDLNDVQSDILTCLFKMADDENLLLVDLKDLKAMLQYASENADALSLEYGNMTKASISAIIRNVVALEAKGGEQYFTDPALNIVDFFNQRDGKGVINILDGRTLSMDSTMYSAFLLWFLSELFEMLPEVGDLEKPRMVFFFDEAHLLFDDISKVLQDKLEQIVKLIRSKGVGVYFVTQNPRDIPDEILAQLGNKIQHALRAYTPSEEKAIKIAAESFRVNPQFDTKQVLSELGVGEALISVLDEEGIPTIVKRCKILPPKSMMGAIAEEEIKNYYVADMLYLRYKDAVDVDSAYEFLTRQASQRQMAEEEAKKAEEEQRNQLKAEEEARKAEEKAEAEAKKAEEKAETAAEKARLKEEARLKKEAEKAAIAEAKAKEKAEAAAQKEAEKKKNKYKKAASSVASTAAGTIGREFGQSIGGSIGGKFGKKLGGNLAASLGRSIMGTLFK